MLSTFSVPYPYVIPILVAAATTWSNMPAAFVADYNNSFKAEVNLLGAPEGGGEQDPDPEIEVTAVCLDFPIDE